MWLDLKKLLLVCLTSKCSSDDYDPQSNLLRVQQCFNLHLVVNLGIFLMKFYLPIPLCSSDEYVAIDPQCILSKVYLAIVFQIILNIFRNVLGPTWKYRATSILYLSCPLCSSNEYVARTSKRWPAKYFA